MLRRFMLPFIVNVSVLGYFPLLPIKLDNNLQFIFIINMCLFNKSEHFQTIFVPFNYTY